YRPTVLGLTLASWSMLPCRESMRYTSSAPLPARCAYYLGLVFMVMSTWITSANLFVTLHAWRKEIPGKRIPLLAFVSVATYAMWDLASIGIAIEFVAFLLPWAFGPTNGLDPLLTRS